MAAASESNPSGRGMAVLFVLCSPTGKDEPFDPQGTLRRCCAPVAADGPWFRFSYELAS
jgi:hypothetical protein